MREIDIPVPTVDASGDAAEQALLEKRLRFACNPAENRQRMIEQELSDPTIDSLHLTWANLFMPVHGTTGDRAIEIFKSGEIASYARLMNDGRGKSMHRATLATDELDEQMGQHEYVFMNVGRVHPADVQEVYLCATNGLIARPGNLVALREVTHFGALVSPEAIATYIRNKLTTDPVAQNEKAVRDYAENVFYGKDFELIFARFLQKFYPQSVAHFLSANIYPTTEPAIVELDGQKHLNNAWEGPQLQIPDRVPSREIKSVLITTLERARVNYIRKELRKCGVPEAAILTMHEAIPKYEKAIPQLGGYDSYEQCLYLNFALKDLAVIPRNNKYGLRNKNAMIAFK